MFFLTLWRGRDIIVPSKVGKRMRCKDCVFCWKDEDEKYPSCKFEVRTAWDIPPCEYEDDYEEEE